MTLIEMLRSDGPDRGLQLQAADEIERLQAERSMLWQAQADLINSIIKIDRLRAALREIANDPCLDPEGNRQIAMLALNPSQEGT